MGLLTAAWALFSWNNRDFGSSIKQLGDSPGVGLPGAFHQSQFGFVQPGKVVGDTSTPAVSPLCVRGVCMALRSSKCLCGHGLVSWTALKWHSLNLTFKPISSMPAEVKQRWLNCEPGVLCGSNKPRVFGYKTLLRPTGKSFKSFPPLSLWKEKKKLLFQL